MIVEPQTHVETLLAQAMTAYRTGDKTEAETLYGQVQRLAPGEPHSLHLLGLLARERGDLEMAAGLIERSIALHPHSRVAHNLGVVYSDMLEHDAALATYRKAVALEPTYADAWANLLFVLDLHPYLTPELLKETRAAFDRACCLPWTLTAAPHENDPDPNRKLRVGYISGDFSRHSAGFACRHLILGHDPEAFDVALYATGDKHDEVTEAFKERADLWAEVGDVPHDELAAIIREDKIDILVDLAGYSKGHRLTTFARRPAPVQIGGWGYGCGTGIQAMDYLVADDVAVPPEHEDRYRSKILRLPSVLSYALDPSYPDVVASPERRNGYRTYGYLGRAVKLNGPTLACWAELLRRDTTGRLLLKGGQFEHRVVRDKVGRHLYALGVDPARIEVRGATNHDEHLAAHNDIDVAVDSFPQNGGITTLDAALMGVPTVTLVGETIQGRSSASMLSTLGMGEWATTSGEDYIETARGCSTPRGRIRDRLLSSIICDGAAYARSVEAAYRTAWGHWCAEQT